MPLENENDVDAGGHRSGGHSGAQPALHTGMLGYGDDQMKNFKSEQMADARLNLEDAVQMAEGTLKS